MSEILKNYLNNEIQLSKKITGLKSIEREFKSGYLFGEFLKKSKQVPIDLSLYNKKPATPFEIKENFLQLKKDLKKIDVNINNYTIEEILANVPNSTSNLLYKIKTQIDRRKIDFENILNKISNTLDEEQKQRNYLITEHSKLINTFCNTTRSNNNFKNKNYLLESEKKKIKENSINKYNSYTEGNAPPKIISNNKIKLQPIKIKETQNKNKSITKNKILNSEINPIKEEKFLHSKLPEFTKTQSIDNSRNLKIDLPKNFNYKSLNKYGSNTIQNNKYLTESNKNFFKYSSLDKGLHKIGLELNEIDPKIKKHGIPTENDYLLDKNIINNRFKQALNSEKQNNNINKNSKSVFKSTENFLKYSIISKNKPKDYKEKTPNTGYFKMCEYLKKYQEEMKHNRAKNNLSKIKLDLTHVFNPYDKPTVDNEVNNENEFHDKILKKNIVTEEIEHENNYKNMLSVTDLIIDFTEECYRCQRKLEIEKVNLFDYQNWLDYFVNGKSCLGIPIKKRKGIGNNNNALVYTREQKMEFKKELRKNRNKSLLLRKNNLELSSLEFNDYLYYRGYWCLDNFVDEDIYGTYLNIYDVLGKDITKYISSGKTLLKGMKNSDISKMNNEEFELRDHEKDNIYLPKSNVKDEFFGEIILLNFENLPEDFNFDKLKIKKNKIDKPKEDLNINNTNNNTNTNKIEETKNENSGIDSNKSIIDEEKTDNNQNTENNNENIKTEEGNIKDNKLNEETDKNIKKEDITDLSHIPIKVCLIGHKYSGRKTQAKEFVNKYPNIKIYSIEEMIDEYIKEYQKLHEEDNKPKSKSKNIKQNKNSNANLEQLQSFAEISEIIEPLVLKKIPELSIEDKTKLLLDKIKKDFPIREEAEVEQENNNRNLRIEQIEQDLKKYEEPDKNNKLKAKDAQYTKLTTELNKLKQEQYVGFILCDFPNNSEEILFFEKKTTGYEQEIDKPTNIRDNIYNKLTASIDKTYINLKNVEIDDNDLEDENKQSIFDYYIYLELNDTETLERLNNRLLDPTTNIMYHTKFNPPPPDDKKLNERLVKVDGPDENEINEILNKFDNEIPIILNTLRIFNNTKKIIETNQEEIFEKLENIIIYNDEKKSENEGDNHIVEDGRELSSINDNENINLNDYNLIDNINKEKLKKFKKKLIETKRIINETESEKFIIDWNKHNEYYCSKLKEFLLSLYNLKGDIVEQIDNIQEEFIDFINTPSQKNKLIEIFMKKYNSFMEKFGYIKNNTLVVEEFEKNIVELTEDIWEIIQTKKVDLIKELDTIIKQNYIGKKIAIFGKSIVDLIVLETKNYIEKINLIQKFYYQIEKNNVNNKNKEISEIQFTFDEKDLLEDIENLPIFTEKKHISPKLNALFKNCIKLLFKYDLLVYTDSQLEAEIKDASRKLTSTSGIASSKKKFATLMRKNSKTNSENSEKILLSNQRNNVHTQTQKPKKGGINLFFTVNFEEDVKNSLKYEKLKYKLRILFLKSFGEKLLSEILNIKDKAINNLDKFIINCVDAQNTAMNNLIASIKKEVIEEKIIKLTIDKNIELDIFKVYDKAKIQFMKFNIVNINSLDKKERLINLELLKQVYSDIKNYEIQPDYITANTAIDILFKKNLFENKSSGFINYMKNIPFYFLNNFINKFITKGKNGQYIIKTNTLFTVLALVNRPVLKLEQKNLILHNSENQLVSHCFLNKDSYNACHLWFEAEKLPDFENYKKKRKSVVVSMPVFNKNNVEIRNGKGTPSSKTNSKMHLKLFEKLSKSLKSDKDFVDESETAKLKNFLFEINKNEYDDINFVEFLNVVSLNFCGINLNKSVRYESKIKNVDNQNISDISADTTIKYSKEVKNTLNASNTFKNSIDLSLNNSINNLGKNETGEASYNELTYFDILIKK